MASAFFLVALALACAWLLWKRQHFLGHLRHVEQIIDDVTAGRLPSSFVFRKAGDFAGLAWRLEHLSDEHALLKKEVADKKFNLNAILASMVEGVLVVDRLHVIGMVNGSFLQMFNLPAEPLGQTILRATRQVVVDEIIRDTLAGGVAQLREITVETPQSGARHFSVNAVPLHNAGGVTTGVVAVFHDLSRLRQLEEIRREFVANVSHELRTPLSIIHGYLENLVDQPAMARGDRGEILTIMQKNSLRLNALLDDLLTLARLESRHDKLALAQLDLDPFVRGLASEWRNKLAGKKTALRLEIAPGTTLRADALRLDQVLGNLLDNALKFSRENGEITISVAPVDGAVEIRVADNGIGIPPADLPHVFERFYRVEKARSRDAGGTGLGLSIVKHIVALHGGCVRAESRLGHGTAIVLSFPSIGGEQL